MNSLASESRPSRAASTNVARIIAAAFPLLVWFFAFFFLLGDTGFWADDYYLNLRGPDGSPPSLALTSKWPLWTWGIRRDFFIRPLFYQIMPGWTTLTWNHPWVAHLVQALVHAGVVYIFWRLMRKLGIQRRAATAGALAFMVYPGHYELVLWVSAFPTLLSVAIMLGVMFMAAAFARARRGWWRAPLVGAACFTACCLNEQPVAGVAVLPFVYWAAVPEGKRFWERRHVVRAGVLSLVGGAAVLVYLYLLTTTAPPGFRGSEQTLVTGAALPGRVSAFLRLLVNQLAMVDFLPGAWSTGLSAVRGVWGWMMMGAVGVAGIFWVVTPRRWEIRGDERVAKHLRQRVLIAMGLGMFCTGWLPIIAMADYPPDSRLRYWPCMGLMLALAAACSGGRAATKNQPLRPSGTSRRIMGARAALAILLIACAVPIIGTQAAYRQRWRHDQSEGAQLRALVPNPAPFTLFQPLTMGGVFPATGSAEFDHHFNALWWFPWSTRKFIQGVYGRADVAAAYWQGIGYPVRGANEQGILYGHRLGPRYAVREGEGSRLAWDRVVPFVVDDAGRVRIVTTLVIPGITPGESDVLIEPGQAAGISPLEWRLPRR